MKNFLVFITSTIRMAAFALVLSAVFSLGQWLFSLMSICGAPTWEKYWFGALALFVLLFIHACYDTLRSVYKSKNDPKYRRAFDAGISWGEYRSCQKRFPMCKKGDVYKLYDKDNNSWFIMKILFEYDSEVVKVLVDNSFTSNITKDQIIDYYKETYNIDWGDFA